MRYSIFLFLLVSLPVWAEGPIEAVDCYRATSSTKSHVAFKLSQEYIYKNLIFKNTNGSPYMVYDLSKFTGESYAVAISPLDSTQGYTLEYQQKGSTKLFKSQGILSCRNSAEGGSVPSMVENKSTGVIMPPAAGH